MADPQVNPLEFRIAQLVSQLEHLDLPRTSRSFSGLVDQLTKLNSNFAKNAMGFSHEGSVRATQSLADHYRGGSASESASTGGYGPDSRGRYPHGYLLDPTSSVPTEADEQDARQRLFHASRSGREGYRQARDSGEGFGHSLSTGLNRYFDEKPYETGLATTKDGHPVIPRIPQIGEFTAQDLLGYMGSSMHYQGNKISSSGGQFSRAGHLAANAGNLLQGAAQFAPKLAIAHQFADKYGFDMRSHTREGTAGFEGTGERVGATGQGGILSAEGVGMRIPFFNAAARKGIQEEFEMFKMASAPGINMQQSRTIHNNLYDRGWLGGAETNLMRQGGKEIMQFNKHLGMNPQTYDAMDKSVRFGATSVKDFVKTMKTIPGAAKEAHVSLEQMVADADALGEINQSQGGTYAQGFKDAPAIAGMTGIPAGVIGESLDNPLVQSYAFRQTGLPGYMQGLQGAGSKVSNIYGAVNELYKTFEGVKAPAPQPLPGRAGELGAKTSFNDRDARLAQLHQFYPRLSVEQLRQMTEPGQAGAAQSAAGLSTAVTSWSKQVGEAQRTGSEDRLSALMSGQGGEGGAFNWGDAKTLMEDAQKFKVPNPETGELEPYLSKDDISAVEKAGRGEKDPAKVASARYNKIKEIIESKGDEVSGGGPKLGLTKEAKKLVKLMEGGGYGGVWTNKDVAGAGGNANTNAGAGAGPTRASAGGVGGWPMGD